MSDVGALQNRPEAESSAPPADRSWAVAIVHGIGNTEPVGLISDVVKAMQAARPGLAIDPYTRSYDKSRLGLIPSETQTEREQEFRDRPQEPHQHARNGRIGRSPVRFATAFWSDVSFSKEGLLNLLGGMVLSGFAVRYLADVAAQGGGRFHWLIRQVLRAMVKMLALFVFPVTLFSLVYSLMGLLAYFIIRHSGAEEGAVPKWQAAFIAVTSLMIAVALSRYGLKSAWPLRRERTLMIPIFSVFVAVAAVFAVLPNVLIHLDPDHALKKMIAGKMGDLGYLFGRDAWAQRVKALDEIGLCFGLLQWLQLWGGIIMIGLTSLIVILVGTYLVLPIGPRQRKRSLLLASISVITLWILIMIMFWPENLVTYAAMALYHDDLADKSLQVLNPDFSNWRLLDWSTWTQKMNVDQINLKQTYLMIWFEVVFLLLVGTLIAVAVLLNVLRWCAVRIAGRHSMAQLMASKEKLRSSWPRLIAPTAYMAVVWFFMLLISFLGILQLIDLSPGTGKLSPLLAGVRSASGSIVYELAIPAEFVRIGAAAGLLVFALVATPIRSAMKLILDVCNHFTAPFGYARRNPAKSVPTYPVRRRIERRLRDTFNYLLRDDDKPHVLVIAHSQGTVIAIEELFGDLNRKGLWDVDNIEFDPWHIKGRVTKRLSDRVESLTILTFGSPLTHVYQHYFAHHYPTIMPPGAGLNMKARDPRIRWVNAYRIDDFVGTYIEGPTPDFPVNVPLPTGGHTAYWSPEVFKALFGLPELAHVLWAADPVQPTQPPSKPSVADALQT